MRNKTPQLLAWESFLTAHARIIEHLGSELERERDMPLTWYDVLIQLQESGGEARMQDLARSILFSKSGLTRLIDRMEAAGLVERRTCPEDGRGTLAVLTVKGRRNLARARPTHLRGINTYFGQYLTNEQASTLQDTLSKMTDALGQRSSSKG